MIDRHLDNTVIDGRIFTIIPQMWKPNGESHVSLLTYARACLKSSNEDLQNLGKALYLYSRAEVEKLGDPNEQIFIS